MIACCFRAYLIFFLMHANLTVPLSLPCDCICRLYPGRHKGGKQEPPRPTLNSKLGAVFQVQFVPLQYLEAAYVLKNKLSRLCVGRFGQR